MLNQAVDGQGPLGQRDLRLDTEIEHRKPVGQLLSRRKPTLGSLRQRPDAAGDLLLGPLLLGGDVALLGHASEECTEAARAQATDGSASDVLQGAPNGVAAAVVIQGHGALVHDRD